MSDALDEIFVNYPTVEDALRQALIEALRADDKVEHGGMLWRSPEGKYHLGRGERMSTGGPTGLQIVSQKPLAGDVANVMYHTHPGKEALADAFSGLDRDSILDVAKHAPEAMSYMVTSERGEKVRSLSPKSADKQRHAGPRDPIAGRLEPQFGAGKQYPLVRTTEEEIVRLLRGPVLAGSAGGGAGPGGGGGW